jgi:hypothetical protein
VLKRHGFTPLISVSKKETRGMFSQNSEEKWNNPYINGKNLYIFAAYLHHKELITKKQ